MLFLRHRTAHVTLLVAGVVALALTCSGRRARAQAPPPSSDADVHASMQCDRANEPGRVRCTVEVGLEGGRTLSWADVELLSLPDFASALKGRIGPEDALARDGTSTKWALGLVARRAGQGEVRARVRLVACQGKRCGPVVVEVRASVSVGG
jgi:hypothetical protein